MPATNSPRRGRPQSGGRERILTATFDVLREKGIARMTTKEIAERARVSEGSIFYHYKDRVGLLTAIFDHALAPLVELREHGIGTQGLRDTLNNFTTTVEQFLERAIVVMFASQSDADLRSALTEYLNANPDRRPQRGVQLVGEYLFALQQSGAIRADINVRTAAFMLISSCMTRISLPWLIGRTEDVPTREEAVDDFVTMLTPSQ